MLFTERFTTAIPKKVHPPARTQNSRFSPGFIGANPIAPHKKAGHMTSLTVFAINVKNIQSSWNSPYRTKTDRAADSQDGAYITLLTGRSKCRPTGTGAECLRDRLSQCPLNADINLPQ